MESFNQNVIRHKTGLLNLAAELGNISKACRMMGVSRDTFYRYQAAREAGGIEALFDVNRRKPNLKNRVGAGKTSLIKQLAARLNYPVFEITGHGRLEFAGLVGHLTVQNGNMTYAYGPLAWRAMGLFPCWAASWKARGTAAMTAALLGDGGEAEAAIRDDIVDVIINSLAGKSYGGKKAGTLESTSATDKMTGGVKKYRGNTGYFSHHGAVGRNEADNYTPEKIASMYEILYNSPDTLVIPKVLGEKSHDALEALWNPNIIDGKTIYSPIVPYKKGFKNITIYDPEAYRVENALKRMGYWEGGSKSSIFTPTLEVPAEQVGSGPIFAVNNPFGTNLGDLLPNVNKKVIPAVLLAAALGGDAAQAVESNEPSASSGGNLRALGLGARDVLEGLGEGVGFFANPFANLLNAAAGGSPTYFSEANAGRALADLLGLPAAESDAEKFLSGISRGAASVLPTMGAGVALNAAKAAPLMANDLLASPRMQAAFGAGVGGFDEALRLLMGE